jgi:hypothetical protein
MASRASSAFLVPSQQLVFLTFFILHYVSCSFQQQRNGPTWPASRNQKSFTEGNEGNKGAAQRGALRAMLRCLLFKSSPQICVMS